MGRSYRNSDPHPPIMQGSPPPPEWRVPRATWDSPPWNRWSFQNVRRILPTANISRGTGPVRQLERAPAEIGEVSFTAVSGATWTIDQMLDGTYTDGFLILRGGRIVHESYFNEMKPDGLHLAQSVSKSVTSAVAGILIGRGLLDPGAPVTDVLPELGQTAWNGATLQHVLDMTVGVRYNEDYTDQHSDMFKTDIASGWRPVPAHAKPGDWPGCIWDQILTLTAQEAAHGARFEYHSIQTDVLAHAMERVTGMRLPELISSELWQKIGAECDACITLDPAGYSLADGGFNAALRDFGRFGLCLLNEGRVGDAQVVPADWVADIRRGRHGLFNDASRETLPNGCYRNQFWIEDQSRETFMCIGVFGQLIYVAPEHDMVAVKLSTWPDFLDPIHKMNTLRALHAIAAHLDAA
jgi:CubicO group peptidase (beta-lactamase class C family)